jgi:hypothetical protein
MYLDSVFSILENELKEKKKLLERFVDDKILVINKETNEIAIYKHTCDCEQCKDRGEFEVFLNDINDEYFDCIKYSEFKRDWDFVIKMQMLGY